MKTLGLALVGALLLSVCGCTQTGISAQDAKDAYGPKPSEAEMERELKKAGRWDEYQQIKERDAAVEAQSRTANASSGEIQESSGQR